MLNFLFVIFIVTVVPAAGAEKDIAVLIRGPLKSKGFPLIYPNALDVWSGYYRYFESEIIVSFSSRNILLPSEWEDLSCSNIDGFAPDSSSFYYTNEEWSVLIQFPTGELNDCIFITEFISRLKYFLRDYSPGETPLFPAILEFS